MTDPSQADVIHQERQGVPTWAVGICAAVGVMMLTALASVGVKVASSGLHGRTDLVFLVAVLVVSELALFAFLSGMKITVTRQMLTVAFGSLPLRLKLPISDVEWCRPITYKPLRDFGGWGIKYGKGGLKAWTGKGNLGLLVLLKDGRKYLIGSDDPETLAGAMRVAGTEIRPMADSLQEGLDQSA